MCASVCDSNSREALTVVNVISDMCVRLRTAEGQRQDEGRVKGTGEQAEQAGKGTTAKPEEESAQVSRRLSDDPQRADSGATKSAGFVLHGSRNNAAPLIELGPGLDIVDTLESQTAFSFRRTASVICTRHTGEET